MVNIRACMDSKVIDNQLTLASRTLPRAASFLVEPEPMSLELHDGPLSLKLFDAIALVVEEQLVVLLFVVI